MFIAFTGFSIQTLASVALSPPDSKSERCDYAHFRGDGSRQGCPDSLPRSPVQASCPNLVEHLQDFLSDA